MNFSEILQAIQNGDCDNQPFDCQSLHQSYMAALNKPGCSACIKKRVIGEYREKAKHIARAINQEGSN